MLAALSQSARLKIVRVVVKGSQAGVPAGDIARAVRCPPSTLSFHLKALTDCGLLGAWPQGRYIRYFAKAAAFVALAQFIGSLPGAASVPPRARITAGKDQGPVRRVKKTRRSAGPVPRRVVGKGTVFGCGVCVRGDVGQRCVRLGARGGLGTEMKHGPPRIEKAYRNSAVAYAGIGYLLWVPKRRKRIERFLCMTAMNHDKALETVRQRAPGIGAWVELAEGVIWIRLPMPGALAHVNVWLLDGPEGWLLVDTGIKTRAVEQAWVQLESQLPIAARLRAVVVTHHHPDHFGMANWFAERHGIEVRMGRGAYAATAGVLDDLDVGPGKRLRSFADRQGMELDDGTAAILGGRMYKSVVSGRPPVREIGAGSTMSGTGGDWRVSLHDGHAPDHLCLYAPHAGMLVSGDQVLPTISSNVSLYPSNEMADPLGDYLSSLRALRELPAETLVLPGHGKPFEGLHARLDALAGEHGSRLEKITAYCSMPRSTADVASVLFNVHRLDGFNRLLAMTETLAHLRYLEQRSMVQRIGLGQALRWHVV